MGKKKRILSLLIVLALVCTLIPTVNVDAASKVKINKKKTTIYVGASETLKVTGTSKTIKWSISNKKVATVSSKGKVTAKKKGTATITAKVSGKKYKCKVIVKNPYLNKKEISLNKGKTTTLKLTGATAKKYKSSNTKVATVNSNGKITAKSAGTATITCTDFKKNTYECEVTVKTTTTHTHFYKEIVIKEPTCTSEGVCTRKCACGKVYTNGSTVIPKKEHEYKETDAITPTCLKNGTITFTCVNCGDIKTEEWAPLLYNPEGLHTLDEGVITTPATCKSEGVKTHTCTTCNKTRTEKIEPLANHTWDEGVVTVQGTCKKDGEKVYKCLSCNETKTEKIASVGIHTYEWTHIAEGDYKVNKCSSCEIETGERAYNLGSGVYGQWMDDKAEQLLFCINVNRDGSNTTVHNEIGEYIDTVSSPPLDTSYNETAKTRALQCVTNYSHDGLATTSECLAKGYNDPIAVSSAWMASSDHRKAMCNYKYNKGGVACLYYDSDNNGTMDYIWVLCLEY